MYNFRGSYKKNITSKSDAQSILQGGRTSELLKACENNQTDTILALLNKDGVNLNEADSKKNTPLLWAAFHNNDSVSFKLLQDFDIDVNATNKMKESALHFAAKNGNLDLINLLINKGINYNMKTINDKLPSDYAEEAKQIQAMGHLLKLERSLVTQKELKENEERNMSEFFNILLDGALDKVKSYFENHSNKQELLQATDQFKRNCLLFVIENNNSGLADYFIDVGANVNHQDSEQKTSLHELCNSPNSFPETISKIIRKGADFTLTDKEGDNPLFIALKSVYDYQVIESIINVAKSSQNQTLEKAWTMKNQQNQTPLQYLIEMKQFDILELTLDSFQELEFKIPNNQYLVALYEENKSLFNKVLSKIEDLNTQDSDKNTILHILCQDAQEHKSLIFNLVKNNKMDFSIQNSQGDTPIFIALKYNASCEFIKELQQNLSHKETLTSQDPWIKINKKNENSISYLIQKQKYDVLELVLDIIDDLDIKLPNNTYLIFEMFKNQNKSLFNKVLSKTNDLNRQDQKKNTIMHLLCQEIKDYYNLILEMLNERDVNLLIENSQGDSPMFMLLKNKMTDELFKSIFQVKNISRKVKNLLKFKNYLDEDIGSLVLNMGNKDLFTFLIDFENEIVKIEEQVSNLTKKEIPNDGNLNKIMVHAIRYQNVPLWRFLLSYKIQISASDIEDSKPDWDDNKILKLEDFNQKSLETRENGITKIKFTADNRRIIGVSSYQLCLWDIESRKCIHTEESQDESYESISFSPSGKKLVYGCYNRGDKYLIKIKDCNSFQLLKTIESHQDYIYVLQFSPSEKKLASGSQDGKIKVWDSNSGKLLKQFKVDGDTFNFLEFTPDDKKIIYNYYNEVKIRDIDTGEFLQKIDLNYDCEGLKVKVMPDGQRMIICCYYEKASIWDINTGKRLMELNNQYSNSTIVSISPNGQFIASGYKNYSIRIWDANSGQGLMTFDYSQYQITSLEFSPDGLSLAMADSSRTVKIVDLYSAISGATSINDKILKQSIKCKNSVGSVLISLIKSQENLAAHCLINQIDEKELQYSDTNNNTSLKISEELNLVEIRKKIMAKLGIKDEIEESTNKDQASSNQKQKQEEYIEGASQMVDSEEAEKSRPRQSDQKLKQQEYERLKAEEMQNRPPKQGCCNIF